MDRVFKSKVDWWFHLLIFILAILCVIAVLNTNLLVVFGVLLLTTFVLHVLFNTYYTITSDDKLILRCGIFPKKEILISDIEALERSVMPVFSYSLSLNRLVIWKEGKMWMMVSPQNEKEFVKLLRKINPDIQLINDSDLLL